MRKRTTSLDSSQFAEKNYGIHQLFQFLDLRFVLHNLKFVEVKCSVGSTNSYNQRNLKISKFIFIFSYFFHAVSYSIKL